MFWIGLSLIFMGLISDGLKALSVILAFVVVGYVIGKFIDRF